MEQAQSELSPRAGYDWVDRRFIDIFSQYRWLSTKESLVNNATMLKKNEVGIVSAIHYYVNDNVCHGREGVGSNFFFIYAYFSLAFKYVSR